MHGVEYRTELARERGEKAGRNAASWVFDGNTPDETRARIAQMLDDGDPEVYDIVQEPAWLSGEWAGESVQELLGDLLEDVSDDESDGNFEVQEAYEEAANEAFWLEVERCAND